MIHRFVRLICLFPILIIVKSQEVRNSVGEDIHVEKGILSLLDLSRSIYEEFTKYSSAPYYVKMIYNWFKNILNLPFIKKLQIECSNIVNKMYPANNKLIIHKRNEESPSAIAKFSQFIKKHKGFQYLQHIFKNITTDFMNSTGYNIPDVPKLPMPTFTRKARGFRMVVPCGEELEEIEMFYSRNVPLDIDRLAQDIEFVPGVYCGLFNRTGDYFVFHDNDMRLYDFDVLYTYVTYHFGLYPEYKVLQQRHDIHMEHIARNN